jgi:hypothetical protein
VADQRGRLIGQCCYNGEQIRIEDLASRTLRVATSKIPQLP